jgi:hypothetical protein
VLVASLVAALLTLLWTWGWRSPSALGERIDGRAALADAPPNFHHWRGVLAVAAYAPLVLGGLSSRQSPPLITAVA